MPTSKDIKSAIAKVETKIETISARELHEEIKEQLRTHYLTGWQLAKILCAVLFPLVGALAALYVFITPIWVDSKLSALHERAYSIQSTPCTQEIPTK